MSVKHTIRQLGEAFCPDILSGGALRTENLSKKAREEAKPGDGRKKKTLVAGIFVKTLITVHNSFRWREQWDNYWPVAPSNLRVNAMSVHSCANSSACIGIDDHSRCLCPPWALWFPNNCLEIAKSMDGSDL